VDGNNFDDGISIPPKTHQSYCLVVDTLNINSYKDFGTLPRSPGLWILGDLENNAINHQKMVTIPPNRTYTTYRNGDDWGKHGIVSPTFVHFFPSRFHIDVHINNSWDPLKRTEATPRRSEASHVSWTRAADSRKNTSTDSTSHVESGQKSCRKWLASLGAIRQIV